MAAFSRHALLLGGSLLRKASYTVSHWSAMNHIAIDEYVLDVLLPDLVGHDRSAPAFLVYLVLWQSCSAPASGAPK
jgi:hypothetical protein